MAVICSEMPYIEWHMLGHSEEHRWTDAHTEKDHDSGVENWEITLYEIYNG